MPGVKVAITGPTGDIGRSLLRALERSRDVSAIVGMGRRPFDPASEGLKKTRYLEGNVLDPAAIARLIDGADVVVHLAFLIMGSAAESRKVNLEGSRNVFEATAAAGIKRLVYTSSVAAYGFHADNPSPLTEDVTPAARTGITTRRRSPSSRGRWPRCSEAPRPRFTCSGPRSSPVPTRSR
jgi:nucleoside-diphosphate-sugar epimerase